MWESRGAKDAVKPSSRALQDFAPSASADAEIITRRPVYSITILIASGFLLIAGAFNLYSASSGGDMFWAHMKHMGIGLSAFLMIALAIRPRMLSASTYVVYALICLLLLGVLVSGQIGGGSRRWLAISGFTGQPSELAKIAVAMVAARFFADAKLGGAFRLRDLWPLLALVGVSSLLIFPQPDLGTATFLLLIVTAQLCFIQIDFRSVMIVLGSAAVTLPLAWRFLLLDYQRMRILSFLNPAYEPQGKGYNVLQSLVAIGSGGLEGKGFMSGTQAHLKFLPMSHSDFIFSVFAEEHGFIGGSLVVVAFFTLGVVSLLIARQSKSTFSSLLAIGMGAFLFVEFAINVAMVLRMFPVKGLPLPFLSAGGSNLIVSCIAVGILVAIDRENRGRFRDKQLHVYRP